MAVIVLSAVFTAVNTTTVVSDHARVGQPIDWRIPTVNEITSAIAIMIGLPIIIGVAERWPMTAKSWLRYSPHYLLATLVFSAVHVTLMVGMRNALYPLMFDRSYNFFGDGLGAIPYEFWKDARTFVLLFGGFSLFGDALKARGLLGTARTIELRSGATRIRLNPNDFLFAKGAANYAEVVAGTSESLARITLGELESLLTAEGIPAVRIHRSYIVNRDAIAKIDPLPGGDLKLTLKTGQTLRASRRYKDALE